jgi:hypothetical protein
MSRRRDPAFCATVRDSWTVSASMHVQSQKPAPHWRQAEKAAADESRSAANRAIADARRKAATLGPESRSCPVLAAIKPFRQALDSIPASAVA